MVTCVAFILRRTTVTRDCTECDSVLHAYVNVEEVVAANSAQKLADRLTPRNDSHARSRVGPRRR